MSERTLLLLVIFCCALVTFGKQWYLITTPNALLSEAAHSFNVFVTTDTVLVIETVHLKSNITNRTDIFVIRKGYQSISYFVPFIGRHIGSALKLRFLGDNCSSVAQCKSVTNITGSFINETREIDVLNGNFIIFSETDKPIYKPGDLVKLRSMAVYPTNLMLTSPDNGQYSEIMLNNGTYYSVTTLRKHQSNFDSITIETPDNVKMAIWSNVSFTQGMNMSFRLTDDPTFGQWNIITVLGSKKEISTFTVKKYVLPRFVVILEAPTVILFSDKIIIVKVCASYSTGKQMQALIRGQFCMKISRDICSQFTSQLSLTSKCVDVAIDGMWFGLGGNVSVYSSPCKVNVTVTEKGTTHQVTKSATGSDIKYSDYQIKFLSVDYFKPNLPYFGKLKLVSHDGIPRARTQVALSCSSQSWGFEQNYTSDSDGIVEFVIPFIPIHSRLTVFANGKSKSNNSLMREPTGYLSLANWESVDNEYIQVSVVEKDIKCPGTIKMKLLTNGDVSSIIIYAQTLSRGIINKMIQYDPVPLKCINTDDYIGHYECRSDNKLKCLPGWIGGNCREPICDGGCNTGACVRPGYCSCQVGWAGKCCETCLRHSSCVHGYCKYGNDCQCLPGWIGWMCDKKGPKIHDYDKLTTPAMTTQAPKPEPIFQNQTVFERYIDVPVDKNMGPDLHVIVYYINGNGEVIADSIEINKKLNNCSHLGQGKFKFNKKSSTPRSIVKLSLDPGTVRKSCVLRISDVALEQFGPSSNINIAYLVNKLFDLNHKITQERWRRYDRSVCYKKNIVKRSIYYPGFGQGFDSRKSFARSGMTAITNTRIVNAKCRTTLARGRSEVYADSAPQNTVRSNESRNKLALGKAAENVKKQIRDFFPETWVFDFYNVTPTQFNLTIPDSMTSWKANSFCMTEKGLWIAPSRLLTVILPFFADIYVPYSIKMGEILQLPVKLFNYVDDCYEIKADLNVNKTEIQVTGPTSFTVCLCANEVKTIYFNIKAKLIGKLNVTVFAKSQYSSFCSHGSNQKKPVNLSDAIRRQLLVEPPGIPSDTQFSQIICNNNETRNLTSSFTIPDKIVSGSLRTYLVYNGDIMGQTFDNLDGLVKMPYGCGEQNMVAFVPSIYVLNYVTNLQIEDPVLVMKAKQYILSGYQRQLTFKHDDGSYSAFGKSDKSGSTWLTAFVLRSFSDASKYVSIDNTVLKEAVTYLEKMQNNNGCFKEDGKLLSSSMAGGLKNKGKTDESLLTAYVLTSLGSIKKMKTTFNISAAIRCVKSGLNADSRTSYRIALSTYALSIHDPENLRDVLSQLRNLSVTSGRYRYWKSGLESNDAGVPTNAADIETTGYALLALYNLQPITDSLSTIYWLANNRNNLGGYFTTQDTIVALNAISVMAEKIGRIASFKSVQLVVDLGNKMQHTDLLTKENRLVTRKFNIGSVNIDSISMTTNGTGCLSLQFVSLYNLDRVYTSKEEFKLTVSSVFTNVRVCTTLELKVCSSYLRQDRDSNMILITIDFPSGWRLSDTEKDDLRKQILTPLQRIDFLDNKIHLYYDSFSYITADSDERCVIMRLEQPSKVDKLKTTFVRMVDYYKPEIYTDATYEVPVKTCRANDSETPPPTLITCPRCLNDSESSVIDFITNICPWSYVGYVTASKNQSVTRRTFYDAKYQIFYEWMVDLEPRNCSCLQSWRDVYRDFVVVSTRWHSITEGEALTMTNYTSLYPTAVLYSAYQSDVGVSCGSAQQLALMMTRLLTDFKYNTTRVSNATTCPTCVLLSTLYYKVKNISELICSNSTRWSLTIDAIRNSTSFDGRLDNAGNETVYINASFTMATCFCAVHVQTNVNNTFVIIDPTNAIMPGKSSIDNPMSLELDERFTIVEQTVFVSYKHRDCKN